MKKLICTFALLSSAAACIDHEPLDVGDEKASLGQALADYAAEWDGYAEAFQFPGDGTDRVRLSLDENGVGVIRFGEEELFPPASDANGPYPPTFAAAPLETVKGMRSGFEFAVSGAAVTGARLQLQVSLGQVMESWCALQPRELVPGYVCGEGGGPDNPYVGPFGVQAFDETAEADGPKVCGLRPNEPPNDRSRTVTGLEVPIPVDCEVGAQCPSCTCDETSCHAASGDTLQLDATLTDDGNALEGTMVTDAGRVTVRMLR